MKTFFYALLIAAMSSAPAFATVIVSRPSNGATVSSPAPFVASATASTCSRGVASMGVYVDDTLKYVATGSSMNAAVPLSAGPHKTVIQEWDNCGGATSIAETVNVTGQTGVFVSSPANNSTVSSSVPFVATASTSSCPQGVSSMGIYVNSQLVYSTGGASLNTQLTLGAGTQNAVVQEWDACGGSSNTAVQFTVQGAAQGKVLTNLQASGGWNQWGELPPVYDICSSCAGVNWSMQPHVSSPSKSGNATRFTIGGSRPYADVLWSNKIMGQGTTQNLPDTNRTLIPNLHNFVYDADFYVTNAAVTQDLEFDVNMYLDGIGMEWGTECNHLADGDWDIWDNVNAKWVSTGFACRLVNGWNHVSFQVQREANNVLLYQTITLNGITGNINKTYPPFSVSSGWYGMTVNYQMDGDSRMTANTTYVDNLNLRYW